MTDEEFDRHIKLASQCGRFRGTCESVLAYLKGELHSKETMIWALERALRYDGTEKSLKDEAA